MHPEGRGGETGWGGPFKRPAVVTGTSERSSRRARKAEDAAPEVCREREPRRPGLTVMGRNKKKKRDGDSRRPRLVLSFDEEKRR